MPLPTEKSKIKNNLEDYLILLYGPSKIGKSTFCSKFPNAFFIATEAGLNSLSVYKDDVTTWEGFLNDCKELATKKDHKFKNVVIDTIDNLYKFCSDAVCKKLSIQHESDLGYGKGFSMVNNEFQRVLTRLSMMGLGLVLISHSQEKEIETRTGKIKKVVPTLPDGARKIVTAMSDIILYVDIEPEKDEQGKIIAHKRVLRTKPSLLYEAGDRTKRLPDTMEFDYDKLVEVFSGKVDK